MLAYPSIPRWKDSHGMNMPCLAFYKYDGSNLRWEWSPKRQWYKFGTRTQLMDKTHPVFGCAVDLFKNTMGDDIVSIVCKEHKRKVERIVAFTEFFGPSSFAGTHVDNEPKQLVLFDVSVYKQGFMEPRRFIKLFDEKEYTAKVVYEGNMNMQFVENVQHGQYPVYEGVICKGQKWTAKIKTFEYLDRLKNKFGDEWEKYE